MRKFPYIRYPFSGRGSRATSDELAARSFAQGGSAITVQNASKQRNFCQFFEIFTNFCKFLPIFCNFSDQLARLMREFIRICVKTCAFDLCYVALFCEVACEVKALQRDTKIMETKGIEPSFPRCDRGVLPLHYVPKKAVFESFILSGIPMLYI